MSIVGRLIGLHLFDRRIRVLDPLIRDYEQGARSIREPLVSSFEIDKFVHVPHKLYGAILGHNLRNPLTCYHVGDWLITLFDNCWFPSLFWSRLLDDLDPLAGSLIDDIQLIPWSFFQEARVLFEVIDKQRLGHSWLKEELFFIKLDSDRHSSPFSLTLVYQHLSVGLNNKPCLALFEIWDLLKPKSLDRLLLLFLGHVWGVIVFIQSSLSPLLVQTFCSFLLSCHFWKLWFLARFLIGDHDICEGLQILEVVIWLPRAPPIELRYSQSGTEFLNLLLPLFDLVCDVEGFRLFLQLWIRDLNVLKVSGGCILELHLRWHHVLIGQWMIWTVHLRVIEDPVWEGSPCRRYIVKWMRLMVLWTWVCLHVVRLPLHMVSHSLATQYSPLVFIGMLSQDALLLFFRQSSLKRLHCGKYHWYFSLVIVNVG